MSLPDVSSARTFLRGLAVLRYSELVDDLRARLEHLRRVREICERFPESRLDPAVRLVSYHASRLRLGAGVKVSAGTVLAFGDDMNGFGRIDIGSGTWVGEYNNLRASGDADLRIGAGCLVSQFCTLVGTNHAIGRARPIMEQGPEPSRRGVALGDDVWLGAGVAVLPGVCIGRGAVIAAGAVVNRDVPEYEIWAGVPARRMGERA